MPRQVVERLRAAGHAVGYILEGHRGLSDDGVCLIALDDDSVIVTRDKDFGEIVFRDQKFTVGIILMRLDGLTNESKADAIVSLIDEREDALVGSFTVISPGQVRIRRWDIKRY